MLNVEELFYDVFERFEIYYKGYRSWINFRCIFIKILVDRILLILSNIKNY